jgi:hypothetical protein
MDPSRWIGEMAEDYESRAARPCVGCGKVDKAPRDQVALPDGNTAYYHMDCHVLIANCQVCKDILATAGGHDAKGKKDEQLATYLAEVAEQKWEKQPKIFTTANAAGNPDITLAEGVE